MEKLINFCCNISEQGVVCYNVLVQPSIDRIIVEKVIDGEFSSSMSTKIDEQGCNELYEWVLAQELVESC